MLSTGFRAFSEKREENCFVESQPVRLVLPVNLANLSGDQVGYWHICCQRFDKSRQPLRRLFQHKAHCLLSLIQNQYHRLMEIEWRVEQQAVQIENRNQVTPQRHDALHPLSGMRNWANFRVNNDLTGAILWEQKTQGTYPEAIALHALIGAICHDIA